MGLPRVSPYLQALGLSTPDPWIHRGIHKTFYTEDSFCFRTLPDQACGAYPGGRNSNLTIYLPSSPHHRLGPPWPLPACPGTKPPRDLGLGSGEGGGRGGRKETQSWTPSPRPAQLGQALRHHPTHLRCCPSEKLPAETQKYSDHPFINKLEEQDGEGKVHITHASFFSSWGKEGNHRHEHSETRVGWRGARRGARSVEGK